MKTLDSYFVTEITPDELFLVNGGGAREVGEAIGKFIRETADEIERGLNDASTNLRKAIVGHE
ncbi:hypothetical protein FACS189440_19340 [Bacteroidia bacterium]|nr:hypothetical protein FACS189423_07160 [Bacteroidia bacterium]GHT50980.1 hypothetical protein FACS189440_19340 [Bacteroidia bacterium]